MLFKKANALIIQDNTPPQEAVYIAPYDEGYSVLLSTEGKALIVKNENWVTKKSIKGFTFKYFARILKILLSIFMLLLTYYVFFIK